MLNYTKIFSYSIGAIGLLFIGSANLHAAAEPADMPPKVYKCPSLNSITTYIKDWTGEEPNGVLGKQGLVYYIKETNKGVIGHNHKAVSAGLPEDYGDRTVVRIQRQDLPAWDSAQNTCEYTLEREADGRDGFIVLSGFKPVSP